ncbi:biotin/lipoyl-containing protein, partial [Pseudomonas sp. BAY1663]
AGAALAPSAGEPQAAPLAGNIFKVLVQPGQLVQEGDLVMILEAMKMETEIRAFKAGTVAAVNVKVGDAVSVGDSLLSIA